MNTLQELAYKLAGEYGYKYSRSYEFLSLQSTDRIKLQNMIMFILEMER